MAVLLGLAVARSVETGSPLASSIRHKYTASEEVLQLHQRDVFTHERMHRIGELLRVLVTSAISDYVDAGALRGLE